MTYVFRISNFFIAMYIYIYKESVIAGGATIENDINNNKQQINKHSAIIKNILNIYI